MTEMFPSYFSGKKEIFLISIVIILRKFIVGQAYLSIPGNFSINKQL